MKTGTVLYWGGVAIVVGSHYAILTDAVPEEWEDVFNQLHAPANLAAAGLIVASTLL